MVEPVPTPTAKTGESPHTTPEAGPAPPATCPMGHGGPGGAAAVEGAESQARAEAGVPDPSALPEPPGSSLPRWRQTLRFGREPFRLVAETREEHGEIFALDLLGAGKMVFLCSADLLSQVFPLPEDVVSPGEIRGKMLAPLVGGEVSLGVEGEEYRARRKITAPFLSGRQVLGCVPVLREMVEEAIDVWSPGRVVRLQEIFDQISRRAISHILFGPETSYPHEALAQRISDYIDAFQWPSVQAPFLRLHLGPWSPWTRFRRRYDALAVAIEAELERRGHVERGWSGESRQAPIDNVLDALYASERARDQAEEGGSSARDVVVHEVVGLLIGGAETTSKALSWTTVGLLSNPQAMAALRRELDTLGGKGLAAEHLPRLPYLDAVVQEGIRYQGVGPFAGPRLAKQDFALGGYRITAGTVLVQALQETGRGPAFPDPETFDPGHFHGSGVKQRDWVPFGGGVRKCTGMGLALVELATVIGTLFQRVELEALPGSTRPVRAGIAYQPENRAEVRILAKRD